MLNLANIATEYNAAVKIDDNLVKSYVNSELYIQIEQMIERDDLGWRCKVCGKKTAGKRKQIMQNHAETHIEGLANECNICQKTYSTRHLLRMHIYGVHKRRNHKELFC